MKVSQYFCEWIVPLKHRKHGSLKRGSLSLGQIYNVYAFPPVLITSTALTVTLIQ